MSLHGDEHDYLARSVDYVRQWAAFLVASTEILMSAESDAARAELAAFKTEFEAFAQRVAADHASIAAANTAAAEDKQALVDLQGQAAQLRADLAAAIAAIPPAA